jgi:hypothetical protein
MSQQADEEVITESEQHEEVKQNEEANGETPNAEANGETESGGDEDEVTVTFGEEAPTSDDAEKQAAPEWVRELRKADREKAREIRELRQKLAEKEVPAKVAETPKPTLADCDYDEEVFEQKLDTWKTQQQAVKAEKDAAEAESRKAQEEWANTQAAYVEAKKSLKLANFDEAEDAVKSELSEVQQALLLTALDSAENVAKLVAALGGNQAELKRIASIKNPIKFAAAAAKLEEKMKVTPRKAPPAPERSPKGGTTAVGVSDAVLERLEAKAAISGDRSEIVRYKRQQAEKKA